jgi:uncharacterized protein YkwD
LVVIVGLLVALAACDLDDADPPEQRVSLPDHAFCDPARAFTDDEAALERAVLERIDDHRAMGADCGDRGRFAPAPPLRLAAGPWCAARVHARAMAVDDHVSPVGTDDSRPADRLRQAGSTFAVADEVFGAGALDPAAVVDALWMSRPGSCAALMAQEYVHVGAGWAVAVDPVTYGAYFAVTVSRPRAPLRD